MPIAVWPTPDGGEEYALAFDSGRARRLLILPPLFEEANKVRHTLVEAMRRLDRMGIDSFLPDLPGCNESPAPLERQWLAGWRAAAIAAAGHFAATHLLTVRAAAILAPPALSGWRYAPTGGANALRAMLRARSISGRESGINETAEDLLQIGRGEGLELAGYRLGPQMVRDLEAARLPDSGRLSDIPHAAIGGSAPWLRAEPGFDPAQADMLAGFLAVELGKMDEGK
ncbi:hypothetical protein H0274_05125 [Altererythrobacter sp. CC-YST694]|uniref:hypothetical protein n=1 Tax=Altererythrobacter sp. CC-YST694 TaxID=2755038 RepID=UPI001D01924D|nr:hypothetical protein [Altererythrobacter sp. CC-YST694]MCB5424632.1 hypothetical protein [Altererythrobacter sp. CC-YST694]